MPPVLIIADWQRDACLGEPVEHCGLSLTIVVLLFCRGLMNTEDWSWHADYVAEPGQKVAMSEQLSCRLTVKHL